MSQFGKAIDSEHTVPQRARHSTIIILSLKHVRDINLAWQNI